MLQKFIASTTWYDVAAFCIMLVGYYYFVRDIKKPGGQTKVNVSTWTAWGILDLLLFFALMQADKLPLIILAYVVGVTWVIVSALRKGAIFEPTLTDYFCFGVAVVACVWWLQYGGLAAAVKCVAIGCAIATIPLLRHLWKNPHADSLAGWSFGFLASCASVLGVIQWTITGALIQVVFLGLSIVVVAVLLRRYLPKYEMPADSRKIPTGYIG